MPNLMETRPLGAEKFHADDKQADMTKLIVGFRNFAKSAWKDKSCPIV
jgi:hypothetical protein